MSLFSSKKSAPIDRADMNAAAQRLDSRLRKRLGARLPRLAQELAPGETVLFLTADYTLGPKHPVLVAVTTARILRIHGHDGSMGVEKGDLTTVTNVEHGQFKRQHGVRITLQGTDLEGAPTDKMILLLEDEATTTQVAALVTPSK